MQAPKHSSELLATKPDIILIMVADAGDQRTFLEQVREHSGELLASSIEIILIIVADAGE